MIIELHINQSLLQITVYCSVYKYNQIKYRAENRGPIKFLVSVVVVQIGGRYSGHVLIILLV